MYLELPHSFLIHYICQAPVLDANTFIYKLGLVEKRDDVMRCKYDLCMAQPQLQSPSSICNWVLRQNRGINCTGLHPMWNKIWLTLNLLEEY